MSASLVGSEMCIRDSFRTPRRHLRSRARLRVARSDSRSRAALKGGVAAVSYTHLTLPTICSV
eukprot:8682023-Alexandrium_andersonii.AAC.1